MRLLLLLLLALLAVACTAVLPLPPPPCSADGSGGVAGSGAHHCCFLESYGFDADDAASVQWLRAQIDTPEFYPLTCDWMHQAMLDSIGRKLCAVGCWGYPIRIAGVDHQAPTLREAMDAMLRRRCENRFASGGYWC